MTSAAPSAVLVVEPRVLRRVIRKHRRLSGVGLEVLHGFCYTLPRAHLLALANASELGTTASALPEWPTLCPRPAGLAPSPHRLWQLGFHCAVHQACEARAAAGGLSPAALRERVHRVGQAEFDEIRFVLRQDDLLLPPQDDREAWIEFTAVFLELRHFDPPQLKRMFPTLHDLPGIDALLARDVDAAAILAATRPKDAPDSPLLEIIVTSPVEKALVHQVPRPENLAFAAPARAKGNLVRAAILAQRGGDAAAARADLVALAGRLRAAIPRGRVEPAAWADALFPLVARAAASATVRRTVELRLLFDLQKAAIAHERDVATVDVIGWALSFGKKPVVRPLPAGREVRIARNFRHAMARLGDLQLTEAARAPLAALLHHAAEDADAEVRAVLRPRLETILDQVGLVPASLPERVARQKLVDELLDFVVAHGYLNLSQLRDAISRNQVKLPDLSGPRQLWRGDALLEADRRLAVALDGVYRPGEIYLRFLQKASSLFFGTAAGRFLTLYAILPILIAFVLLEGVNHLVEPFMVYVLHREPLEIFTYLRFAALALFFFGILHSEPVRKGTAAVFRTLGQLLHVVLIGAPRWLWRSTVVQRVIKSGPSRWLGRWIVKPGVIAGGCYLVATRFGLRREIDWAIGGGLFVVANILLNSRGGAQFEEIIGDWLVRTGRELGRRILPGTFHLIVDFFKALVDAIERFIYLVDEQLRFRKGDGRASLWFKGTFGVVWAVLTYLLRVYLNLFIEPTINPIKHFPVVTVAAKIQLPLTPHLLLAARTALVPIIGTVAGNAVAGFTVLVIPGVWGFLVWELKENWKLYQANRPANLRAVPIGHHGETMVGYLKPGFHSGTIPKTYGKLRRAAWKGTAALAKHREALHHIEETIRLFAERELAELLDASTTWTSGNLTVGDVEIASNRVRLELRAHERSAWLGFEEQSGWLLAGVVEPGWIADLAADQRDVLETALAGFYKLAGVDMVREQLTATVTHDAPYDIADEGLVMWPDGSYQTEVVYELDPDAESLTPEVRGAPLATTAATVAAQGAVFARQPLPWATWVAAWSAPSTPRVVSGARIV